MCIYVCSACVHVGTCIYCVYCMRCAVVRQVWPWTCYVNMKHNKLFYVNEIDQTSRFDEPPELQVHGMLTDDTTTVNTVNQL